MCAIVLVTSADYFVFFFSFAVFKRHEVSAPTPNLGFSKVSQSLIVKIFYIDCGSRAYRADGLGGKKELETKKYLISPCTIRTIKVQMSESRTRIGYSRYTILALMLFHDKRDPSIHSAPETRGIAACRYVMRQGRKCGFCALQCYINDHLLVGLY
jgi:hypothetical protein